MRQRFVLLALAAVLPVIVLVAGLSFHLLETERSRIRAEAIERATAAIAAVDRELDASIQHLQLLALTPTLDAPEPDFARFHLLAKRYGDRVPFWDRIILNALDGRQLVNTALPFGTALPRTVYPDEVRRVLATRAPVIGDLAAPGPLAQDSYPSVRIRVPVVRGDDVRYDLTAVVAVAGMSAILTGNGLDPQWRPFLVDSQDRIVSAPRAPEMIGRQAGAAAIAARRQGDLGVYPGTSALGTPVVTAFRKSERTGWSAHYSLPADIYNAPLNRARLVLGAAGLVVAGLTAAFVLLLRREAIEARRQLAALERTRRLEAVGRMTGGVAHDFNNILTVVTAGIRLIERTQPGEAVSRYLEAIKEGVDRGTKMTRSLLVFSRGGSAEPVRFVPDERIRAGAEMVRQTLGPAIGLALALEADGLPVVADATQFDLALLNLAANARDAMPSGGTLTISTAPGKLPGQPSTPAIGVTVADTGSGIPAEILAHVFEPFFTTKDENQGTGLGLSQVYGFARSAGGLADIASEPGRGTRVTMHLPVARSEP
ncbi:sensor histidine kinase [Prosthecomicrobium sp. N25]|uniref:sensor histidine kinase n=1 Tax=Prosthecomicrobium sp. N25 TaxID=3129254 RepID=UPI00307811E7